MKHFMCTHTFHSEETKKIFFKAHFGKKIRDWFSATNDEENVNVSQHGSEKMASGFVTGQLIVKI